MCYSQAPVCICGGLLFGAAWGILIRYFPEKGDAYVIPLRTLMLFAGGLLAVIGSEHMGYEGGGPLAVVFAAFIGYLCNLFFLGGNEWILFANKISLTSRFSPKCQFKKNNIELLPFQLKNRSHFNMFLFFLCCVCVLNIFPEITFGVKKVGRLKTTQ